MTNISVKNIFLIKMLKIQIHASIAKNMQSQM